MSDEMTPDERREYAEAVEAEHSDFIISQRRMLEGHLRDAIGSTGNAVYLVRRLSSNRVYDVEYAEGNGDALRLLELAMSALAGAQAIAEKLHR